MDKPASTINAVKPARFASIDAYRGFVMLLMMVEALRFERVAKALPESRLWQFLAHHQSHAEWVGCSLHDLIQPSFSFLVGVALPFSLAGRRQQGQSPLVAAGHAAWRSFALIALGILLRSVGRPQTNFTFEDTLTQIGLGYFPLFLLGCASTRVRWTALVVLLVGYWAAFALHPLPTAGFDYAAVGVKPNWPHQLTGFAAHWSKNSNFAWEFDRWFMNILPRAKPFTYNGGGYCTLSFVPTLATMILGLFAGDWLRSPAPTGRKLNYLVMAGAACLALGWAADRFGVCPNVKRIWTPSWTLFSGGWCFLLMAGFYCTTDAINWRGWSFPLRVIGCNSIAAYCLAHLIEDFAISSLKTHLGQDVFDALGPAYEPLLSGAALLTAYWLILYWMQRRGIYLRI